MTEIKVESDVTGTAWKIVVTQGQAVEEDDPLMIAVSMKMEIPLMAPEAGVVKKILVEEGSQIAEGEVLFLMDV
jgi:acetyl-CoA carboxylase biotin carboxyl carrier protein